MSADMKLRDGREALAIDPDNIDDCLIEQPGLYYGVADAYVLAVAEKDRYKLLIEETTAELDKRYRAELEERDERVTENKIQQLLTADPELKKLRKEALEAQTIVGRWQALKEAYQQRSFMLRELVAVQMSELSNLNLERGAHGAGRALAERNRAEAGRLRREGRGQ